MLAPIIHSYKAKNSRVAGSGHYDFSAVSELPDQS